MGVGSGLCQSVRLHRFVSGTKDIAPQNRNRPRVWADGSSLLHLYHDSTELYKFMRRRIDRRKAARAAAGAKNLSGEDAVAQEAKDKDDHRGEKAA